MRKRYLLILSSFCMAALISSTGPQMVYAKTNAMVAAAAAETDEEKAAREQKAQSTEKTDSGIIVTKADKKQYVTTNVNVRADATTTSEILGTLNPAHTVHVIGICENKWAKIEYENNKNAYVCGDYLIDEDKVEKTDSGVAVVKAEKELYAIVGVNVRADCTKNGEILDTLQMGDAVMATGICENDWIRIQYEGKNAYVYGEYLSNNEVHYNRYSQTSSSDNADDWDDQVYENYYEDEEEAPYGYNADGTPKTYDQYYSQNGPSDDEEAYEKYIEEHRQHTQDGPTDDEEAYEKYVEEHKKY